MNRKKLAAEIRVISDRIMPGFRRDVIDYQDASDAAHLLSSLAYMIRENVPAEEAFDDELADNIWNDDLYESIVEKESV